MSRICDAIGCKQATAAGKFMCPSHWWMVPLPLQRTIYARYRAGRTDFAFLSDIAYLQAAVDAIDGIAKAEGRTGMNAYTRLLAVARKRAGASAEAVHPSPERAALERCLDVLLRMVPQYCARAEVEQCTDAEHDAAIGCALAAFHGADRTAWPPVARDVVEGRLE